MRISTFYVLCLLFVSVGCKKPSSSSISKPAPEFAELVISLESNLENHCIIELDRQASRSEGIRSYSSSVDRDYVASVAFCYVGDYEFMDSSPKEPGGRLIAIKFTKTSPESDKVIHTETVYCNYTGDEKTIIEHDGVKIMIKKADTNTPEKC